MALFGQTLGTQRLRSEVINDPTEIGSWGTLRSLEVLATRLDDRSVGLIVINQSGTSDVTATVQPQGIGHKGSDQGAHRQRSQPHHLQHA
jgi:hypothetical protein